MNNERMTTHTPWIFWPIRAVFDLIEWVLRITGRLVAAVIGLVIMITGLVLTISILAAPIGIPMMVFGLVLMVRGIF